MKLWYISRADLSQKGNAATLHSSEDVRCLIKCGWDACLYAFSKGIVELQKDTPTILVTTKDTIVGERLLFELKIIVSLFFNSKPDFIFFRGPTNLIFIGLILKLLRIPFGIELNGVFAYRYEKFKSAYFIEKFSDHFFMKNSKVIVSVTEELMKIAIKESDKKTIHVVARNGVNVDSIKPHKTMIKKDGRFVFKIGYLGKCYQRRGLNLALDVVKELKKMGINVGLLCVGGGPLVGALNKKAATLGIQTHVEFRKEVVPNEMSSEVADCHFMWAYFQDWQRYYLTGLSPLKIWTYLAMAKPVLLRDLHFLKFYKNVPGIFWFNNTDPKEIALHLLKIWDQYGTEGLKKYGQLGRQYVIKESTWQKHAVIIDKAIKKSINIRERISASKG